MCCVISITLFINPPTALTGWRIERVGNISLFAMCYLPNLVEVRERIQVVCVRVQINTRPRGSLAHTAQRTNNQYSVNVVNVA